MNRWQIWAGYIFCWIEIVLLGYLPWLLLCTNSWKKKVPTQYFMIASKEYGYLIDFVRINLIFIQLSKLYTLLVFSSGGSTMQWRPTTTSSWTTTTTSSVEPGKCPSHQWQRQQQRQHLQWFNDISGGFGFSGISRGTSLFSSLVTTASPCPGPP